MNKVIGFGKGLLKIVFMGLVIVGTCIMNFIGAIICAIAGNWGVYSMERREDTPARISRRNYEEKNKDYRKEKNKVWGTSIERKFAEEIDAFLKEHDLKKVDLIYAGFQALQNQYGPKTK